MTRHRTEATLHYAREDFRNRSDLAATLSRERPKDTTLDYSDGFAARRGVSGKDPVTRRADRFIAEWTEAKGRSARAGSDLFARRAVERDFHRLATQLHRDPELRQALAKRRGELGIDQRGPQRGLAEDLARSVERERGLDRGR
jgi:hypothetical protein